MIRDFSSAPLEAIGDNSQALKAIRTAIAAVPAVEQGKYYYLWRYQSVMFEELSNDDALTAIEAALKLEPNNLILLNKKAHLLGKKQQYREAIAIYDLIISQQPEADDEAYAYASRGFARYNLGQNQSAIADYDIAININPNEAVSYYNRGLAKYGLGQYQSAITDYDRAIAINSNDAMVYVNRGACKYELGQRQAAITDYDKAITIDTNNEQAYYNRGSIQAELRQEQAAIADFDKAIAIDPNFAQAYANRGIAKSELGQKQAAISDLNLAAELFRQQNRIDDYHRAIGFIQTM